MDFQRVRERLSQGIGETREHRVLTIFTSPRLRGGVRARPSPGRAR